jgi:hypothetical protein
MERFGEAAGFAAAIESQQERIIPGGEGTATAGKPNPCGNAGRSNPGNKSQAPWHHAGRAQLRRGQCRESQWVGETAAHGNARRQRSPMRELRPPRLSCAVLQPAWPELRRPITRPPSCWSRIFWCRVRQNQSWCVRNSTRPQTRFHNAHALHTEIVARFAQSLLQESVRRCVLPQPKICRLRVMIPCPRSFQRNPAHRTSAFRRLLDRAE